jgi:glycosyltransferase involved in cell wall biosynthesis
VVASTAGAIPEVAGPAAALVPPGDLSGMALRIADLAEAPGRYADMAEAGRARSRRFLAPAHGPAVAGVYHEVAAA